MELAGRAAAEAIHTRWSTASVAVLCGAGNNGGDGYVVARWLSLWGHDVRIWAPRAPTTPDARANRELVERMGLLPQARHTALDGAGVIVDALLGTGQRQGPQGAMAEAVADIRGRSGVPVVAMDLPTGICADTGAALGGIENTVHAHLTITFGAWKPGLLCEPGASLAGEIECVDIGFGLAQRTAPKYPPADAWLLTAADIEGWLPRRTQAAAKWDRGHVAIRAGGGAAVLAALGAFAGGAGLVTLLVPRADWPSLHGLDPSVILAEPAAFHPRRHDVLVIGPGLGIDRADEVRHYWSECPVPVVADADALTVLAEGRPPAPAQAIRVLTPHVAEAAALLGLRREKVEADRFGAMHSLSAFGTVVLKGPHTLIGGNQPTRVNPIADDRLAMAGSGDVLAGLLGALLAQKLPPVDAASLAVWLHSHAAPYLPANATAAMLPAAIRQAWPATTKTDATTPFLRPSRPR